MEHKTACTMRRGVLSVEDLMNVFYQYKEIQQQNEKIDEKVTNK
ncbi:hypothetical protein [Lentibacillus sp. Marseille-P4043]|nr:hypothetical protein [Lentibacillus sp. Marseille-P4043]